MQLFHCRGFDGLFRSITFYLSTIPLDVAPSCMKEYSGINSNILYTNIYNIYIYIYIYEDDLQLGKLKVNCMFATQALSQTQRIRTAVHIVAFSLPSEFW